MLDNMDSFIALQKPLTVSEMREGPVKRLCKTFRMDFFNNLLDTIVFQNPFQ